MRPIEIAASAVRGTIDFYLPPSAQFGVASSAPQFNVAPTKVATAPLDDLLDEAGVTRVDVLKLDVEGAELDVLRGAATTLTTRHPLVVFEFNDWAEARLHNPGEAQRELLRRGYRLEDLAGRRLAGPVQQGSTTIIARKV